MSMIAVDAVLVLSDPASRDALVARSVPLQAAVRDREAGCLMYCLAADPVRPEAIQLYELWADEAALDAHFQHPNFAEIRKLLRTAGLVSAVSNKMRVEARAPVYGREGKPTSSFD